MQADTIAEDILKGADAIGAFLGLSRRQAYHAVSAGHLPTFKIGAIICARKSTLTGWIAAQEGAANDNGPPGDAVH